MTISGWIFDKRINLGNLLTACVIAVSVIWWAAQIEKRIAVLEIELKAFYETQLQLRDVQLYRDERQDSQVERLEATVKKGFERLNTKLDKVMASGS